MAKDASSSQNDDLPGDLVINETVRITEYAPAIFDKIKKQDGITAEAIRMSLAPKYNRDAVFKAGES
jgi:hypothetical protein